MKKLILFSLLITVCSTMSFAQLAESFYNTSYDNRNNGTFSRSTGIFSLGYGLGNDGLGYSYVSGSSSTSRLAFGPVYAKYEHGIIRDEIGLGGHLAFANTWNRYSDGNNRYRDNVNALSFAMLGYYHFNKLIPVPRLDVYVGSGISVRTVTYNYDSDFSESRSNTSETNVYAVGKIGARYYVGRSFGFYAEAGTDRMSDLNLGISFKL